MHSSHQGMAGAGLRAAQRGFLGLRRCGASFLGSIEIPPCRLAHAASAAQRQLAASAQPVSNSASSYADRAAARRASRRPDTVQPREPKRNDTEAMMPAVQQTASERSPPTGMEQRAAPAAAREKAAPAGQQFASMSDTLLADMTALLGEPTPADAPGVGASQPAQSRRATDALHNGADAAHRTPPVATGQPRRQSAAPSSAGRQRQSSSDGASSAGLASHSRQTQSSPSGASWGQVMSDRDADRGNRRRQAEERVSGGLWGQVLSDRHAATGSGRQMSGDSRGQESGPRQRQASPGSSAQHDSLDWDCLESGAAVSGAGLQKSASQGWSSQGRGMAGVDQRGEAVEVSRRTVSREERSDTRNGWGNGRPGVGQGGDAVGWGRGETSREERRGPPGRRPYRLTHRERVKLCLESNSHMRDAFAAAQVLESFLIILSFPYLFLTGAMSLELEVEMSTDFSAGPKCIPVLDWSVQGPHRNLEGCSMSVREHGGICMRQNVAFPGCAGQ